MIFKNPEYRAILRHVLFIVGLILLNRVTKNYAIVGLAAYGIVMCLKRDMGKAISVYILLSLLPLINPILMPRSGNFAMMLRLTSLAMTIALIFSGSTRRGGHMLPLGTIFAYLFVAVISSTFGYCPIISYLKIFNFAIFISGIYLGTKNIHLKMSDITTIRYSLLAIVVLLVYGSLLTLPFPAVAYFITARRVLITEGLAYANSVMAAGGKRLFTGITVHSQFLGPMIALCFGWLMCDMWLVKRKINMLHVILMAPIPIIAYMTRARIALVTFVITAISTTLLCMPRVKLSAKTKRQFRMASILSLMALVSMSVYFEIKDQSISKWLRKSDDLVEDTRSLNDAFTASRQKKIDENLLDFQRNRIWGSGFQVDRTIPAKYKAKQVSIFSASVEKSILPLMVLGETGIIGGVVFIVFLISFFSQCKSRRYFATSSLFIAYLSTNIAEATFFAPSGGGGVEWIFCVVGGFALDMYTKAYKDQTVANAYDIANDDIQDESPEIEDSGSSSAENQSVES